MARELSLGEQGVWGVWGQVGLGSVSCISVLGWKPNVNPEQEAQSHVSFGGYISYRQNLRYYLIRNPLHYRYVPFILIDKLVEVLHIVNLNV